MSKIKYTPMMSQYLKIKENYQDTLILFRLGDFYELFFDDAVIASKELELVLTGRDAGVKDRVPMCGVPYHAIDSYIDKLIKRGYKVGIVEQLEDPALAKGIVKRDVVQIMSPGTLIGVGLKEKENNYILAIHDYDLFYTMAFCDISTGELGVLNVEHDSDKLINEIMTFESKELLVNNVFNTKIFSDIKERLGITISRYNDIELTLDYENLISEVKDLHQIETLKFLIDYLVNTQKRSLDYLQNAKIIKTNQYLKMDSFTRNNLELTRTLRSEDRYGSLLWVIDKTKTAMGSRLLKSWIQRPLVLQSEIEYRLVIVDALINNFIVREELVKQLDSVYDLPRLIAKISYGNANGRDLIQLANSLSALPKIKEVLQSSGDEALVQLSKRIEIMKDIVDLIGISIVDNPPVSVKEGGIIKAKYNENLDDIRKLSKGGKEWIANFEKTEKERTGIKSLKIGFNKVFGFYIEVTNSYLNQVKDEFGYIRKQTLTGSERFITKELKEKEDLVLNAEEKMIKLEYEIFLSIRDEIKKYTSLIQKNSDALANIDVFCSYARVSVENNYIKPTFSSQGELSIKDGRHPVIEKVLKDRSYVPNDIIMDESNFLQIITGPNMGGKSTYMRQNAIIAILAQIGCYVPAKEARLPIFDAIFTRIGASDDLVSGQSTFMVEMLEVNNAIANATEKSLIVFDEIGRGTSTFDGMAIAQSIIEHIAINIKAMTLFSTHYHELVKIAESLPGVINVNTEVHEENNKVTFLYKIKPGSANKSYGINVARLAHIPSPILDRAKEILEDLENKNQVVNGVKYVVKEVIKKSEIEKEIQELDPLNLTPLEALNYLYNLKKKLGE